jgi:predicted DNA-binding transcriptional regulator AlpA
MRATLNAIDYDTLLTEVQAAEVLSLSSRTLQAWRNKGYGPSFVRAGRAIRYRHRDLVAWIDTNTVSSHAQRSHTMQAGGAA